VSVDLIAHEKFCAGFAEATGSPEIFLFYQPEVQADLIKIIRSSKQFAKVFSAVLPHRSQQSAPIL
jgi:hypothetical protein